MVVVVFVGVGETSARVGPETELEWRVVVGSLLGNSILLTSDLDECGFEQRWFGFSKLLLLLSSQLLRARAHHGICW